MPEAALCLETHKYRIRRFVTDTPQDTDGLFHESLAQSPARTLQYHVLE